MSSRTVKTVNQHSNKQQKNHKKLQATNKRHQKKSMYDSSSSEDDTPSTPPHQQATLKKQPYFYYHDKSDDVYAGPTFSIAPAPSALPIPAFNTRGSPIQYHATLEQQSMDLMNLLSPPSSTNQLSEIQRGLCSMLKIQS